MNQIGCRLHRQTRLTDKGLCPYLPWLVLWKWALKQTIFRSECSSITRSEAHRTSSQQHKLLNIDHKLLNIKHKLLNMSPKSLNTSGLFKLLSNSSLQLQIWVKLTDKGSMSLLSLAGNVEFGPKSIFRSECSSITRSESHRTSSQQHKLLNIDHKLLNIKHKLLNWSQKV